MNVGAPPLFVEIDEIMLDSCLSEIVYAVNKTKTSFGINDD